MLQSHFSRSPSGKVKRKQTFGAGDPAMGYSQKNETKISRLPKPLDIACLQILPYRVMFEVYLFEIDLPFSIVILILCSFH